MTNVTQLHPAPTFDDFWRNVDGEMKKGRMKAEAKFDAITSPAGLKTRSLDRDSGLYIPLHLKATPEELVTGIKRYYQSRMDSKAGYKLMDYTCGPVSWLNQGRWEDD